MFKKTISLFLVLTLSLLAVVGCPPADNTDATSAPDTSAPEASAMVSPYEITLEKLAEYTVVRGAEASQAQIKAAQTLRNAISETLGTRTAFRDDTIGKNEELPEKAFEILVGTTNRPESAKFAESFKREFDFVIAVENDRVVINGGCDEAVTKAVEHFIKKYVVEGATSIVLDAGKPELVEGRPYMFDSISINGVDINNYTIVYPENTDRITYYTAIALYDYLNTGSGAELNVVADTEAETEYEILVGVTNRAASAEAANISLGEDKYILCQTGSKIVMQGASYFVAAAASDFVNNYVHTDSTHATINVTTLPTTAKASTFTFPKATSAILMIGDGMGQSHIDMTIKNKIIPEFVANRLPVVTTCKTYSQSVTNGAAEYTDSAASATALATGYKTLNSYLGLDANGQSVMNVRELAHSLGLNTAVVTTDTITGATPSGFLCHHNNRNDTSILKKQIDELLANGAIDYLWGAANSAARPELVQRTREALNNISEYNSDFFIMVEEAYIDKNSHNNDASSTMSCVERYNECISYCIAFTMMHPKTALIITADHECGGILESEDGFIYTSTNHTNTNVPLFALGGGVKEWINSTYSLENIDVAKHIASIFGSNDFGQAGFVPMPTTTAPAVTTAAPTVTTAAPTEETK